MFALSQDADQDSTVNVRTIIPSIYVDYGKLLTIASSQETKFEGGLELLFFEKFPLIIEGGSGTLSPERAISNGTYESKGIYFRIGTGIYSQFTPKNKLGFTARYGSSKFDEKRTISIESSSGIQPGFTESVEINGLAASWFELVLYSDKKINDLLSIGMNLRYRVMIDYNEQTPVDVYSIPGYGRSFDNAIPAANLFLKISF
jgi:hypothetical protein